MSRVLRVPDGRMIQVARMFDARVGNHGHKLPGTCVIFDAWSEDIIMGLNFFTGHAALIAWATGVLRLELRIATVTAAELQPRLRSTEHVRLPPKALTYLPFTSSAAAPDGDYIV